MTGRYGHLKSHTRGKSCLRPFDSHHIGTGGMWSFLANVMWEPYAMLFGYRPNRINGSMSCGCDFQYGDAKTRWGKRP